MNNLPEIFITRWKIFAVGFVVAIWLSAIENSGLGHYITNQIKSVITPAKSAQETTPTKKTFSESVLPKLAQNTDTIDLKKDISLIEVSRAGNHFDEANAYIVVNTETGEIITEKNSGKPQSIASLTKVMTSVVALDLASPEQLLTVTQKAADTDPTKIGVVTGEKMKLEELLEAALLTSANDAVEVIRSGIDELYGEEVFVKAMNEKAKVLGLKSSQFTNPQGFDHKNHLSSPEDLVKLSVYALENYPLIAKIAADDYQFLAKSENHKQFDLYNWNGLVGVYPGTKGLKIGYTDDARHTTIVTSTRENKTIMSVVLGAPTGLERDLWAAQLLDYGFQKTAGLEPINVTESQLKEKYSTWKFFE